MFKHLVTALAVLIFSAAPAHADRRIEFTASGFYGGSSGPQPGTINGAFEFYEDPTDFSSPTLTKIELVVAGHAYTLAEVSLGATRSMLFLLSRSEFEQGNNAFQMFTGANGNFFSFISPNDNAPWYADLVEVEYVSVPGIVPEPETYAMLLAGLALLGAVARRRRA